MDHSRAGEDDAGVPGAPPVLLPHERVEVARADAGREHDRQVDQGPAARAHVEPGVHVLGVGDERRAALRLQRGPPVDRRRADAGGLPEPVAGHLHRPVEHLLDRAGGVLDPRLRRALPEELGGLDDSGHWVVHVGEGLGQEVGPRREVRVEDDQVLAAGAGEGVPQVAALLIGAQIGPADVAETERLRRRAGLVARPVVEDVGLGAPRVGRDELEDRVPGAAEHLDRLAADRQVDVDARVRLRVPGPDPRPVGREVEAAAGEVHRQADRLVDEVGDGDGQERPQRRAGCFEPELADDQAGRADDKPVVR